MRWACDKPVVSGLAIYNFDAPSISPNSVRYVSLSNALAYCKWVGRKLPTVAEYDAYASGLPRQQGPLRNLEYVPSPDGDRGRPEELLDGLAEWTADGRTYGTPFDRFDVVVNDQAPFGLVEEPVANGTAHTGFRCID